ncbi:MRG domain containing protein [Gracilaria domingensis]|nr:MRG domain containing protein [Gracilaria domingensis]
MAKLPDHDRPIPSDTDFEVNTLVLAFHGNLLYEATILSIDREPEQPRAHAYLVHFHGWKKSWDEKVPANHVFQHNDDNLLIAHRLLDGANRMRQQAVQALQPSENEKESRPLADKNNSSASSPSQLFQIPPGLQRQLVDDWDAITRENRLVPLPRPLTVQALLQKWVGGRRQSSDKAAREVAEGLQIYFDAALPMILLYHFERKQYRDRVETSDKPPSAIYGPEHLLRLLFKLPFILEEGPMEREKLESIAEKVNELAKYMQKHGKALFQNEYDPAPETYIRTATECQ